MKYTKEEIEKIIKKNRYAQYGSRDDESAYYRDDTPAKLLVSKIIESQCGFEANLSELCLFLVEYTEDISRFSFENIGDTDYFIVKLDNEFLFSFIAPKKENSWEVWDFIDFETTFKKIELKFDNPLDAIAYYQENISEYFYLELDYETNKIVTYWQKSAVHGILTSNLT